MGFRLARKAALITGAGGGIGSETARLFAREGASVVVNDVHPDRADAVVESIRRDGGTAIPGVADISSEQQVQAMFEQARTAFGGIDVLATMHFSTSAMSLSPISKSTTGTARSPSV